MSANHTTASGCLPRVFTAFIVVWIILVSFGRIGGELLASAMLGQMPSWIWFIFPAGQAIILLLQLVPLALYWKIRPARSVFQFWLTAALVLLFLAPLRLLPETSYQIQALTGSAVYLIVGSILPYILKYDFQDDKNSEKKPGSLISPDNWLLGSLAFGILSTFPWLAWGALGSIPDTVTGILLTFSLGFYTSRLWNHVSPQVRKNTQNTPLRNFMRSGFYGSIFLFILATTVPLSYGGSQLLLSICLPAAAWLLAALEVLSDFRLFPSAAGAPVSILLIGLIAAGPILWVDPDELALIISFAPGEIFGWSLAASALSSVFILISAGLCLAVGSFTQTDVRRGFTPDIVIRSFTGLVLTIGVFIYFRYGQVGLYGEGLFVVLNSQTNLTISGGSLTPTEKRAVVYNSLVEHAEQSQSALRKELDNRGLDYTAYYLVNAIQVEGGPRIRLWLESRPEVDRVLPNPWLRPLPEALPTASGNLPAPEAVVWNLSFIHADRVWQELNITGAGITIGHSDSGVDGNHPDLAANYRGADGQHVYNWYDPWFNSETPVDIGGHGTHTLGTILGRNTGVAPDASWFGCVNLARNLGNPALYLDCMQFMLAPHPPGGDPFLDGRPEIGAHVINNSWGCPSIEGCDQLVLQPAVNALAAAGIFVVTSAGNDGPACGSLTTPPAIYPAAFSVGALDSTGNLAAFSSRGPVPVEFSEVKPDLVAPGAVVLSTMPGETYAEMSGTSAAGPHVAGTVALLWSANPELIGDIETTTAILHRTAKTYQGELPACPGAGSMPGSATGYGVLDAYAAVRAAMIQAAP